jgi:toxin-antitoxin system PIN domain toxin
VAAAQSNVIAIDTNLLVYAHRAGVPESRSARGAIERAAQDPRGWGFCLPSIAEFWSIVTHPGALGRPSTPAEALAFFEALITGGAARVFQPGPAFIERLMRLAADLRVTGTRIFDLQIALMAFDSGATEIWTHDRQFVSLPGLRIVDPLS